MAGGNLAVRRRRARDDDARGGDPRGERLVAIDGEGGALEARARPAREPAILARGAAAAGVEGDELAVFALERPSTEGLDPGVERVGEHDVADVDAAAGEDRARALEAGAVREERDALDVPQGTPGADPRREARQELGEERAKAALLGEAPGAPAALEEGELRDDEERVGAGLVETAGEIPAVTRAIGVLAARRPRVDEDAHAAAPAVQEDDETDRARGIERGRRVHDHRGRVRLVVGRAL